MNTLHAAATEQYSEHYARMNPAVKVEAMPERYYRNLDLMFGALVNRLPAGSAVADLGCGAGFLLHWLAQRPALRIFGVDASSAQVEHSRLAAPDATLRTGDILDFLEAARDKFAVLFCMDVLEHVESDDRLLKILRAAWDRLDDGGVLVCRTPNAAHLLGSYGRYIDVTHHRGFTPPSMRQTLRAAGFREIRIVPAQSSILLGRIRLWLEYALHRILFLLGGYPDERVFTQNLIAIARR